ncbi:LAFA_0E00166g1_1 [Lachancea sp. 'fantastica']|nr:LAFA_0C00144g1_1 [Lachancea sp. 'fantastica']SCU85759.1 LAFA_0D17579g1_1 [Lachancea sp. 'fantastica']SCU86345.1 LAFA_0E00166g1_1 [Lachancea sp. 'fantastica']
MLPALERRVAPSVDLALHPDLRLVLDRVLPLHLPLHPVRRQLTLILVLNPDLTLVLPLALHQPLLALDLPLDPVLPLVLALPLALRLHQPLDLPLALHQPLLDLHPPLLRLPLALPPLLQTCNRRWKLLKPLTSVLLVPLGPDTKTMPLIPRWLPTVLLPPL